MTNPRPKNEELPRYYQSKSYISHSNKANNIVDRVYKISRSFTLKWKYSLIQNHSLKPPSSVLDFGCGTGDFLQFCNSKHLHIEGVEPSSVARSEATRKTGKSIHPDATSLTEQFDVITLWHVLEHIPELNQTLEQLKNRLAKNGTMFIAVPNLNSADAKTYGEHWAAYDVPRHLWHFSRSTMERILKHHDLKLIKVLPMWLDAYYVSLLSEKYANGRNSINSMAKALLSGWQSNQTAKRNHESSSLIYVARK